jgi:DHA2 family multidrug resistance protein
LQGRWFIPSLSDQGSLGVIYGEVIRQASMLSFNDAFYLLSMMMMLIIPLVLLMKKGKEGIPSPGVH